MASFDIISDVHLDQMMRVPNDIKYSSLLPQKSPNLIIAGDVTRTYDNWTILVGFITISCDKYDNVIYVLGNHEYYNNGKVTVSSIKCKIKNLETYYPNLKVLDCDYIMDHYNKLIIFGATLWSKLEDDDEKYIHKIPIYETSTNSTITVKGWNKLHENARESLDKVVKIAKEKGYRLIVVTHYSPLMNESLNPQYWGLPNNVLYCTDLAKSYPTVSTWIFGHTGNNCNLKKGSTRFISNQYMAPNYYKDSYRL
jgi:predicted phosphodiesterase